MVPFRAYGALKACVCGRSIPEIAGSNPTEGVGIFFWTLLCVVRPLRLSDHSSRGLTDCGLSECDRETSGSEEALAH
jgi:hypothetical protein